MCVFWLHVETTQLHVSFSREYDGQDVSLPLPKSFLSCPAFVPRILPISFSDHLSYVLHCSLLSVRFSFRSLGLGFWAVLDDNRKVSMSRFEVYMDLATLPT